MRTLTIPVIVIPPLLALAQAGTVTTTADSGSGSLRAILAAATSAEVIGFSPSLNGQTITLSSGPLQISSQEVTLDASTLPSGIKLSGNNASRILTIQFGSNVTLKHLELFAGRESSANGGGIFASNSQLRMEDCIVRDCSSGFDGGGVWISSTSGGIARCRITGNQATNFGGGMFLIGASTFDVTSTQVSGNRALVGGGVYNFVSSPVLTNCTIHGNIEKGMVSQQNSHPKVRNSVIWGNRAAAGSSLAGIQISNSANSDTTVDSSLVEGANGSASFEPGNTVIWNTGNLDGTSAGSDPRFIGAPAAAGGPTSAGDLRPFPNSPLINAGSNAFVSESLDLARRTRISGAAVDIGAFEGGYVTFAYVYPALSPAADANQNGRSNFIDYALGFDPTAPGSGSSSSLQSSPGGTFLTVSRRTDAADFLPGIESSVSLAAGSWQPLFEGIDYVMESSTAASPIRTVEVLKLTPDGPLRFYRQSIKN